MAKTPALNKAKKGLDPFFGRERWIRPAFSGPLFHFTTVSEIVTATSDADGIVILETATTEKGSISFEFCVVSIIDPIEVLDDLIAPDPPPAEYCDNF